MSSNNGIETQLFDVRGGWDEAGDTDLMFYDVVSKVPLGNFPVGTMFSSVVFSFAESLIELYQTSDEMKPTATFRLNVSVGNPAERPISVPVTAAVENDGEPDEAELERRYVQHLHAVAEENNYFTRGPKGNGAR